MKLLATLAINTAAAFAVVVPVVHADDACVGFKWDISKEHALFTGTADKLDAGKMVAGAPALSTSRLYELALAPQTDVRFALPPGKKMLTDGAFAGVASFKVDATGTYRVSVDVPFWIDVVDSGKLVETKDFGGQPGCLPHKVVAYDLIAGQPLILQISASSKPVVHVTITFAPTT